MPEGSDLRWSDAQQAMLREMGFELYEPRTAASVRGAATVRGEQVESRTSATVRGELVESRDSSSRAPPALPPTSPRGIRQTHPERGSQGVRLVLLANGDSLLRGPHATLVRALLRALGVRESDIRGEPHDGIPAIAFGHDAPGALRAPSLHELRTAAAKRAFWPALRALRKQLKP